ncbi:MAG: hypothetical protein BWY71_02407 [Planctomycetes bacterium ADurb.Bin412]|nr:MAG: hypothetical protein BWY71_02407 [Planctomycetes bacterium ADurb.Bin412]
MEDVGAGGRVEPVVDGGVGDRLEGIRRYGWAAGQNDLFTGAGHIERGCLRSAGVLHIESKGLAKGIYTAANDDGERFTGWGAGGFEFTDGIAGAFQGPEGAVGLIGLRLGQTAGPVVAAAGCDVEIGRGWSKRIRGEG